MAATYEHDRIWRIATMTENRKPATVRPVSGLKGSVQLEKNNKSNNSEAGGDRQEFVLATLRSASLRVRLIDNEIAAAGAALRGGLITPETALEWVKEVAPGCVGYLPAAFAEGQAA
jgi:hypothetical protein